MTYPDAVYLTACDHITNGDLIETACKKAGCSVSGLRKWAARDEANVAVYARARLASAAALEEEALEVARSSTAESYQQDRLRVDTLKWAAAKRHPREYGDRVEHTGKVEMEDVTPAAVERAIASAKAKLGLTATARLIEGETEVA